MVFSLDYRTLKSILFRSIKYENHDYAMFSWLACYFLAYQSILDRHYCMVTYIHEKE